MTLQEIRVEVETNGIVDFRQDARVRLSDLKDWMVLNGKSLTLEDLAVLENREAFTEIKRIKYVNKS